MEDNTKQINNSIASGRSYSIEVTEKDSQSDVQIKKPELLSLKCSNLEKMFTDIIENDSEVQPSVSSLNINTEESKVEEAKQRISDVSPNDYTREHVLSDLKVYLSKIGEFISPTKIGRQRWKNREHKLATFFGIF